MSAGPGELPAHIRARGDLEGQQPARSPTRLCPPTLQVGVYDNHAHLEFADGDNPMDFTEHLDRAGSVGVLGVVQVGTDVETSRWSAALAHREPRVLAAVAIHPNEAPLLHQSGELDEALGVIDELAAMPRVVAVGETGLDFYRTPEELHALRRTPFEPTSRLRRSTELPCKSMIETPMRRWWRSFWRSAPRKKRCSTASAVMQHSPRS
jgi:TatD DNase family protein